MEDYSIEAKAKNLDDGLAYLAEHGLNLVAVMATDQLPNDVFDLITDAGIDFDAFKRIVLLGHGGSRLWEAISDRPMTDDAPIDRFSIGVATRFIDRYLAPCDWQLVYPGSLPLPLQRLGKLAGWCHPSPLGSGISREFGLWFAYRVAFVTSAELPVRVADAGESPCLACKTRDCVATCPSRAVQWGTGPDIDACVGHRLQPASSCAEQCLARLACPHAAEHRYGDDQLRYHYRHSLNSIGGYMDRRRLDDGV